MPQSHTVTDRVGYYQITLDDWGEANTNAACHVLCSDILSAVVLEPSRRSTPTWNNEDELRFRSEVQIIAADFDEKADILVFDPGRANESSVNL